MNKSQHDLLPAWFRTFKTNVASHTELQQSTTKEIQVRIAEARACCSDRTLRIQSLQDTIEVLASKQAVARGIGIRKVEDEEVVEEEVRQAWWLEHVPVSKRPTVKRTPH